MKLYAFLSIFYRLNLPDKRPPPPVIRSVGAVRNGGAYFTITPVVWFQALTYQYRTILPDGSKLGYRNFTGSMAVIEHAKFRLYVRTLSPCGSVSPEVEKYVDNSCKGTMNAFYLCTINRDFLLSNLLVN